MTVLNFIHRMTFTAMSLGAVAALSACAAPVVINETAPAAYARPAGTGEYPNLNIRPQPAAPQIEPEARTQTADQLKAIRDRRMAAQRAAGSSANQLRESGQRNARAGEGGNASTIEELRQIGERQRQQQPAPR